MNGGLQAAPSGVVTFLFTDIEGSTRRWEADADVMRRALATHDDTMHRAVQAHGGWLFNTPVTASVRRSPRHGKRWMRPSTRSGR
ncbi:hypothetical protein [Mycobacterium lehmannii]|uniref:hypothetical protein n=1 Tax=Mycobacterium lehmannii TaxID=2048550 RepID=UPI002FCE139F